MLYISETTIFEWDEAKNISNIEKHGIDFGTVKKIFLDTTISKLVSRDNLNELRYITFGKLDKSLIIAVIHTDRHNAVRIISARKASRKERGIYEKASKKQSN